MKFCEAHLQKLCIQGFEILLKSVDQIQIWNWDEKKIMQKMFEVVLCN